MRQADSTIKGYIYQFNKSIYEILLADNDSEITLEGVIEDIDISSPTSLTTIQCKYHEDKKYQMSSVAVPILEMLCNFCETSYLGKDVKYKLYAYYQENVDDIELTDFINFIKSTQDKDIIVKYFYRIYSIPDSSILATANKIKKSSDDKNNLIAYYNKNKNSLSLRVAIADFWKHFEYIKAEQFDALKESILVELCKLTDVDTASSLFYPNAFSYIASMSSKADVNKRKTSRGQFIDFLSHQKTVLLNQWTLEALDRKAILKAKKESLAPMFASNTEVRAFLLSDGFLHTNSDFIIPFIREYVGKYYKKPRLQKPPIFIFGSNHSDLMQNVIVELYKYQQTVNNGMVGLQFFEDSFINGSNYSSNYVCKVASECNISIEVLEKCLVNQLYIIGKSNHNMCSINYEEEILDISSIKELKYLIGLNKTLEV